MLRLATILVLFSATAHAQSYLPQTNCAAAQAKSQTMCAAMKCDGKQTMYWWPWVAYTGADVSGNTCALIIASSGPYGVTTSNVVSSGTQGLSGADQSALLTAAQLGPLLPAPVTIGVGAVTGP